jgi:predicted TIM-barrel fold metal-dependent hydrolase
MPVPASAPSARRSWTWRRAAGQCPIILAHAGISDLSWLSRVVPDQPNLFFDTAWIVPADLLALFALVPLGRILYGSDAPYMDVDFRWRSRCAARTSPASRRTPSRS